MARMPKKKVKRVKKPITKNLPAPNIKLSARERALFIGATEEDITFECPVRGMVTQRVLVKKFKSPADIPPVDPKYAVKIEDDLILDDEDFSNIDVNQTLDLDPVEIDIDD